MEALTGALQANELLALLDPDTLEAIAPTLERVDLALHDTLYEEGGPMPHAWFPTGAVFSLLAAQSADRLVEIGTIGKEGVLGVPLFHGATRSPGRVFAQVSGPALRMPAADYLRALEAHPPLERLVRRYAHALFVQAAQGSSCNRLHAIEQRCARWLLQTHDRVHGAEFDLTQEFLAQMLGERRAAVNQTATGLQQGGLIRYSRGRIQVLDRAGLEAAACPCYRIVREEYARMLARSPAARATAAGAADR